MGKSWLNRFVLHVHARPTDVRYIHVPLDVVRRGASYSYRGRENEWQPTDTISIVLACTTNTLQLSFEVQTPTGQGYSSRATKKNILTHHASSPQYTPSRKHSTHANQFNKYTFKLNAGFYCSRFRGLARFVGLLAPARAQHIWLSCVCKYIEWNPRRVGHAFAADVNMDALVCSTPAVDKANAGALCSL